MGQLHIAASEVQTQWLGLCKGLEHPKKQVKLSHEISEKKKK
jgi:hypothetical protein